MKKTKKPTMASLKKELKIVTDRNYELGNEKYELKNQIKTLEEKLEKKDKWDKEKEYYQGIIEGMNGVLNKFQFDMTVKQRNLTDEEIRMLSERRY